MINCRVFSKTRYLALLLVAFVAGCASNAQEIPVIADTVRPTVSFTAPAPGDVAVPINRKISVAFSEVMDAATITAATFTLTKSDLTPVSGTVAYVGTSATFTPSADLVANTSYTATITTGAKDPAGNALAENYGWTFTTGTVVAADTAAPTVSVTSPTDTAIAVPADRKITIGFSEAMDPATVTTSTFKLAAGPGLTPVTGKVTPVGTSAVFVPDNKLVNSTLYTATVTTGVTDLAGNAMAHDFIFTFTTGIVTDSIAPTVVSTIPLNGVTGVANNSVVTATFNESMDPLSTTTLTYAVKETVTGNNVPGVVTYADGSKTATFTPGNLLTSGLNYTATVKSGVIGVKDLAGNALVSDYVWKFTVGAAPDIIAPTVILVNPLDTATDVALNSAVNATFSKEMNSTTISTATFTVKVGVNPPISGIVTYDVASKTATFQPAANLIAGTTYIATVTTGTRDLAGNALAVDKVWSFSTGAVIPPPAAAINLGNATSFGIAAGAGLTSTGITVVNGDVSLTPTATCTDATGLPGDCAVKTYKSATGLTVNGSIYFAADPHDNGVTAAAVKNDLNTAWLEGKAKVPTKTVTAGQLSSVNPYAPGIYHNANLNFAAGGVATLDGGGDSNATFIFQVDTDLTDSGTTLLPSEIKLIGSTQAKNVWFVVGRDAVIGNGSIWKGNVLAGKDLTVNIGATMLGRALSGAAAGGAGAISLKDHATISVP